MQDRLCVCVSNGSAFESPWRETAIEIRFEKQNNDGNVFLSTRPTTATQNNNKTEYLSDNDQNQIIFE